jgi:hypothetical protein
MEVRAGLTPDDHGKRVGRLFGLSMGLLFLLIAVLQAVS